MMRRRGFTLIEMVFVLSILGILVTLTVPRIRDAFERGEAAALHERVYSVRVAYEAAGNPTAERMRGPLGDVPAQLAGTLNPDHFRGEGGVTMRIVGQGATAYLLLTGSDPSSRLVLEAFHRLARVPHVHTAANTLVPLSAAAIASIPATHGNTGGNVALQPNNETPAVPPLTSQPSTTQPPVAQMPQAPPQMPQAPPQQPVTQQPVAQQPVAQQPVTQQPVTQQPVTQPPVTQPPVNQPPSNAPVCSSSLPPGLYKQCQSGTTHGNGNGNGNGNGHGNANGHSHAGGWFRN